MKITKVLPKLNPTRATLRSQAGMVSIVVSLVMMIVITIVVLGFSQLSRNELTSALNRQLSAEAFYAANSGINNTANIVSHDINSGTAVTSQTGSCTNVNTGQAQTGNYYTSNQKLNGTTVVYSCVTVDPTPSSIVKDIDAGASKSFPIQAASGAKVSKILFSWEEQGGNGNFTGCNKAAGQFNPSSGGTGWPATCSTGVLQVDLIDGANTTSQAAMEANSLDFFLYPTNNGGGTAYTINAHGDGIVYGVTCGATLGYQSTPGCTASINVPNKPIYYARVLSIYKEDIVTVAVNNGNVPLSGAQVAIDSTGKAENVLQRLTARVSLAPNVGTEASYAIESGESLCKLIAGYPGSSPPQISTPTGMGALVNDEGCKLN